MTAVPLTLRRTLAESGLPRLFDGHLHLVADDQQRYPRVAPGTPPPGAGPGGGGLPPGVGGQPGGHSDNAPRAETDAERVVRWMDEKGVQAAAAVQKKGTYGFDNSYIIDSSDKYPTRFRPVVVLDAEDIHTPDQVRQLAKVHGLAGVRLTGGMSPDKSFSWLSSPQAHNTWAALEEHGLVADLMITAPGRPPEAISELSALAERYPRVRLVLDHAGYPIPRGAPDYGLDALQASLSKHRNIYYKVTAINLDLLREAEVSSTDFVRRVVDVYGPDRVLWGSDAGNSGGSYGDIVKRILASTQRLTEAERIQVLHDVGDRAFERGGRRA
ncbi:MAG: amidohydrolase family protein [Steroidobacteraceae bacterium]